jgi:hypothetical protein
LDIIVKSYKPDYLDSVLPPLPDEKQEYRPPDDNSLEPPVRLDDYGMQVWKGDRVVNKQDGKNDTSASLVLIGRVLYDANATRKVIVDALNDRDESLGWRKYTDRSDREKQYHAIVDELESN